MLLGAKSKVAITVIFFDPWGGGVSGTGAPSLLLETHSLGFQNLCLPSHTHPALHFSLTYLHGPCFSASKPSSPVLGLSASTPGPSSSCPILPFHSLSMEPPACGSHSPQTSQTQHLLNTTLICLPLQASVSRNGILHTLPPRPQSQGPEPWRPSSLPISFYSSPKACWLFPQNLLPSMDLDPFCTSLTRTSAVASLNSLVSPCLSAVPSVFQRDLSKCKSRLAAPLLRILP